MLVPGYNDIVTLGDEMVRRCLGIQFETRVKEKLTLLEDDCMAAAEPAVTPGNTSEQTLERRLPHASPRGRCWNNATRGQQAREYAGPL